MASIGKRHSEQEENLRKEGFQTMDDDTLDKVKFLEGRYPGAFITEEQARLIDDK